MAKTPEIDLRENFGKNYIINGDMRIAQRGTSFPAIAGSTYSLDRWTNINNTSAVYTITQDSDVPTLSQAGYLFQNSLKVDVTTADASVAAGDRVQIRQVIEGYNWANIAQKPFTVSFWVKATKTGTYCISLVNNGSDRSYVAEYTINVTNTWEKKSITILASPSAGGWNYTNSVGIVLSWTLMAGTNFNTTAGAWQSGNLHSTSNQVNSMDSTANDFWLTGVMVNEGAEAPTFRTFGKDFPAEVIACQRYYEKSWELTTNPLTITFVGALRFVSSNSSALFAPVFYKVQKRAAATFNAYSPSTAAVDTARAVDFAADRTVSYLSTHQQGACVFGNVTNANADMGFHWIANAEL